MKYKMPTKHTMSKVFTYALAVLIQVLWIVFAVLVIKAKYPAVSFIISLISTLAVLVLLRNDQNPAYKLAWTILILAFPAGGAVVYILFSKPWMGQELVSKLADSTKTGAKFLTEDELSRQSWSKQIRMLTDNLNTSAG